MFDALTALRYAIACQAADSGNVEAIEQTTGLQHVALKAVGDNLCYVGQLLNQFTIVFRDTQTLGGWVRNLEAKLVPCGLFGRVHEGFKADYEDLKDWLLSEIPRGCRLAISGHSKGGALAALAAADFGCGCRLTDVYTFGAPSVGDMTFAAKLASIARIYRVEHEIDPVPDACPAALGYAYHGERVKLWDGGLVLEDPTLWQRLKRIWWHVRRDRWRVAGEAAEDHMIGRYIAALSQAAQIAVKAAA
jgi:Lipase (class 3)